jgi:site-specific DNA-methyltransferase (adenine-specific)|tara:strand:+ start:50 stop:973 length:924 start_codon:yes stop_codon:yes gene_type:complete
MKLYKGDCLIESDKIESGSVDLILTDLPYGTVKDIKNVNHGMSGKCEWDEVIDTNEIYKVANRILRKNGKMVLFAQQPFTNELINKAIPNISFCYSMIWEKDHFANALTAKKAPLNYYEDILVFNKSKCYNAPHPLIKYAKEVIEYIDKPMKEITSKTNRSLFYRVTDKDFGLPTLKGYLKLIDIFNIDKMHGFKEFAELKEIDSEFKKKFASIFNLWEGNKYKSNILKYKKDYNGYHPTQKPVLLLEDLIKTFSNENDLVVDLTMGSGSTGVAAKNTNRNFIGIEQDENYFNIAQKRIKETEYKLF